MSKWWLLLVLAPMLAMAGDSIPADSLTLLPSAGVPDQMKDVAFMVGTWDCVSKMNMGDSVHWFESKGVSHSNWVAGGSALQTTYESEVMGEPFVGVGLMCFNRQTGKWQQTWVDNNGAYLSVYEGTYAEGKFVFEGDDYENGRRIRSRETMSNLTPTSYDWTMEVSPDGGKTFTALLKATYAKRSN
jgi:hypothetical protein